MSHTYKKKCYVSDFPTDCQKNAPTVFVFLFAHEEKKKKKKTKKNKKKKRYRPTQENPGFYIRSLHNLSVPIFGYCRSSSFIYLFPITSQTEHIIYIYIKKVQFISKCAATSRPKIK